MKKCLIPLKGEKMLELVDDLELLWNDIKKAILDF
jgi:hypothetical protein